jgi:LruC domain-containing protein
MYVVNASTNQVVQYYKINGFINSSGGGDLAFASDGQLYLACFSGLYKFTSFDETNEEADIIRVSAENFPYQLTSMAIDRNDDIYVGTNNSSSKLIRMSIQDGSHEIVETYNHKINDLTAWRCAEDDFVSDDSDGDGVVDQLDAFPNDSTKAAETFTPSELGWGSIGFEDLWPAAGDYDFNDLVMHYRFTNYLNAQNLVVESSFKFKVSALNASYKNGFGLELPYDESLIESVTGSQLTEGALISLNSKGLETGQNNPVIIVFDNAFEQGNYGECVEQSDEEIEIIVKYVSPTDPSILGSAPYNPFIFINGDRSTEVHLSDQAPTTKGNQISFGTFSDDSNAGEGRYYKTAGNLPWAIHIIHNFRAPRSGNAINLGYSKFNNWATSAGVTHSDWYKDNSGYRNTQYLCID